MPLREFLADVTASDRSLIVANRSRPEPVQELLETTFVRQPVRVDEYEIPALDDDVVLLVDDGDVVATSKLEELEEALLLVNSDLFITGTRELADVELPDVLEALTEVPFRLRGYPESNKEKLLLILISRYIERLAWESDGGELRASFQRLSRMRDEHGTLAVYEQLAASETETHVYGVDDDSPPIETGLTMHSGDSDDYRNSWFVVYETPAVSADDTGTLPQSAALLAIETADREWNGYWTFDPSRVATLNEHIATAL